MIMKNVYNTLRVLQKSQLMRAGGTVCLGTPDPHNSVHDAWKAYRTAVTTYEKCPLICPRNPAKRSVDDEALDCIVVEDDMSGTIGRSEQDVQVMVWLMLAMMAIFLI